MSDTGLPVTYSAIDLSMPLPIVTVTLTDPWRVILYDRRNGEPVGYDFTPTTYDDRGRLDALFGTSCAPSPLPGSAEFHALCVWLSEKTGAPMEFVEYACEAARCHP
jgi:hypothetical protein